MRLLEISRLTPAPPQTAATEQASSLSKPSPKKKQPAKPSPEAEHSEGNTPQLPAIPNRKEEEKAEQQETAARDFDLSNLDLDRLLERLRRKINKVEKNRWSVISVPEGWVLAQPDALWGEVKRMAKKAPVFLTADADEQSKREMLRAVVQRLADEKKAVATELLGEGYNTTQCLVITPSGKSMRVPLIPFRAEVFSNVPSKLEFLKSDTLNRMIKKVKVGTHRRRARANDTTGNMPCLHRSGLDSGVFRVRSGRLSQGRPKRLVVV